MPLVILQDCQNCHERKDRAVEFPNRIIGRAANGKPRRKWAWYCRQCLEDHPKLMADAYRPDVPLPGAALPGSAPNPDRDKDREKRARGAMPGGPV